MTASATHPRPPGVLAMISRIGLVRLIGIGFPLLAGLGLVMAFHFEVGRKRLTPPLDLTATLALMAGLVGVYALLVRLFEGRWPRELALRPGARLFGLGLAIGVALFCAVYAILTLLGVADWRGFNGFSGLPSMLLLAIVGGVGEELIFRGVVFRLLEESAGTLVALALSAGLFGLMHAGNPGSTAVSTLAIALEAGLLLAGAYAWSRSLWLPIGIHIAWNFTEGGVFGAPVSGGKAEGLFGVALSKTASPLITGGAFGPEASLVAIAVCLALAAVFLAAAHRAGAWRPPTFRLVLDRGPGSSPPP